MKNTIIIFTIIIVCLLSVISYIFALYKSQLREEANFNKKYEKYLEKEVIGSEIATLINQAINNNEKYNINKNEKGLYIDDEQYYLDIKVKFIDSDEIYNMEAIYKLGITEFINNFSNINFKCTKIEHHKKSNRVSILLFEEI